MNRVQALAPIAFLVACGCVRDQRAAELPPESVAFETPRWTVVPLATGERPDLLVVDWDVERPAARRVDWVTGRALALGAAPREASFRVFRRPTFEWLVPGDLDVSPEVQVVDFLGGLARDIDVRFAHLSHSSSELAGMRDLVDALQAPGLERRGPGRLMTR